jgi:hypothetical protein
MVVQASYEINRQELSLVVVVDERYWHQNSLQKPDNQEEGGAWGKRGWGEREAQEVPVGIIPEKNQASQKKRSNEIEVEAPSRIFSMKIYRGIKSQKNQSGLKMHRGEQRE